MEPNSPTGAGHPPSETTSGDHAACTKEALLNQFGTMKCDADSSLYYAHAEYHTAYAVPDDQSVKCDTDSLLYHAPVEHVSDPLIFHALVTATHLARPLSLTHPTPHFWC